MTVASTLLLAASALVVGGLIGCVGVGGVLLPPALLYFGGLDLHLAMATAMWSFLFTGVAGTVAYSRSRTIDRRTVLWLVAGVVPAAVLGALTNTALPAGVLKTVLAVLVFAAGLDALLRRPKGGRHPRSLNAPLLLSLGAVVGFGSALTGTGGPVLLVPALVLGRVSALAAVGASQVVQIPVAAFATLGHAHYGETDLVLGAALGIVAATGVVIGARVAHALPLRTLRNAASATCVGTGALMLTPGL